MNKENETNKEELNRFLYDVLRKEDSVSDENELNNKHSDSKEEKFKWNIN